MTEGEAFVYSGGGVGVFGEVGVPDAALKEKKWSRIVITLGSAPRPAPLGQGQGHPSSLHREMDFDDDMDEDFDPMERMSAGHRRPPYM